MTKTIVALVCAGLLAVSAHVTADNADSVVAKQVVVFLTNVHTGRIMKVEEWFTQEVAKAPIFAGFGGIDAMVRQSTAQANKYGGLGSVSIAKISREGNGYLVTAEVKFRRDHRDPSSPAAIDHEDMIWELHLIESGGRWKIWK